MCIPLAIATTQGTGRPVLNLCRPAFIHGRFCNHGNLFVFFKEPAEHFYGFRQIEIVPADRGRRFQTVHPCVQSAGNVDHRTAGKLQHHHISVQLLFYTVHNPCTGILIPRHEPVVTPGPSVPKSFIVFHAFHFSFLKISWLHRYSFHRCLKKPKQPAPL